MVKKSGRNSAPSFQGTTLREENTGRNHASVSSILKMKHLQRLATWAASEAIVPPLGALFGNRLAANAEAAGIPLDPSTSLCQRCESILQPDLNCTVRIEKIKNKARRRKKSRVPSQNNVVYTCHFCSHRNLKGGTPKGHVKGLLTTRQSLNSDSISSQKVMTKTPLKPESVFELNCSTPRSDAAVREAAPIKRSPITPLLNMDRSSQKKRKECVPRASELRISEGNSGSNKRRRRGWTRLKEIAETYEAENSRSISNIAIPFLLQCEKKDDVKMAGR